jgi:hypothetical protein
MSDIGIEVEPATDGVQAHVYVALEEFYPNGPHVQSRALTTYEVDLLIDRLIDAQRQAKTLFATYRRAAV